MNQPTLIDLTGKRFGHWTVLQQASARGDNSQVTMWLCKCDCGTIREVNGQLLRNGRSRSCGCERENLWRESTNGNQPTEWRLFIFDKGNTIEPTPAMLAHIMRELKAGKTSGEYEKTACANCGEKFIPKMRKDEIFCEKCRRNGWEQSRTQQDPEYAEKRREQKRTSRMRRYYEKKQEAILAKIFPEEEDAKAEN